MKNLIALLPLLVVPVAALAAGPSGDLAPGAASVSAVGWTGCSLGANVGVGTLSSKTVFAGVPDVPALFDNGSNTASGVVGGGQAGCDYQHGTLVFGLRGLFAAATLDGSNSYTEGTGISSTRTEADWFASLTGRLGVTITPATLLYARAGAAWVSNDYTDRCVTTCSAAGGANPNYLARGSDTRTGWLVGAGLEHALDARWSLFAEYTFMDFGNSKTTLTEQTLGTTWQNDYGHEIHAVLAGVNLRFR